MNKWLVLLGVAAVAGCATVRTVPTEVAIVATSTQQHYGIAGELRLKAGMPLVLATVDDKRAYCSQGPVAFNIGEQRGACFFDTNGTGYFDTWYMLGTISSATMGGINIPYSVMSADAFRQRAVAAQAAATAVMVSGPAPAPLSYGSDCNKGWKASPEMEEEIARRDAGLPSTEQRAHAECTYQAQTANITTPGLLSGFLAGIGAGQVCENYYRNIGVMH